MRVAWFTPFVRGSAIGRVGQGVVAQLARLCDVEICYFGKGETLETSVPVKTFRSAEDVTPEFIARYDLLIYHMGNYLPYHGEIFALSQRFRGIVVLHDLVMHHFFASYYLEHLRDPAGYILSMSRNYGETGAQIAEEIVSGRRRGVWETDEVVNYPAFEDTIRGALGVVAHSTFLLKKAEKIYSGPMRRIALAYECDVSGKFGTRADLEVDEDAILIVTVGHVNTNKCVDSVINALSELGSLPRRFLYAVLGPISPEYAALLQSIVDSGGLTGAVRFCGAVSDEVLRSYLRNADFCINLRFPVTEGASASVIEEMLFGKATIVNNVGFFAELPDEAVVKVELTKRRELTAALKNLITQPALRQRVGEAAKEYATREHRADRYARDILEFAEEVRSTKPILQLCDHVALELRTMGVPRESVLVSTVSEHLEELFVRPELS